MFATNIALVDVFIALFIFLKRIFASQMHEYM